jgi:TRAP-type C4-dicarboxylate transport system permease small subunit
MRIGNIVYRWLDIFRNTTIVVFFSFVVISGFAEVVCRYVFLESLGWTEEILRNLNIWVIFLGASIAASRNEHLYVNYFYKFLPLRYHKRIQQGVYLAVCIFLAIFTFYGALKTFGNIGQQIYTFPISIAWFYLAIPVGSFLMLMEYMLICIYGKHPFHKSYEEE